MTTVGRLNSAQATQSGSFSRVSPGRSEEAIQDFDKAIEIYQRTVALLKKDKKLDEAANWNPSLALAYNNRGSAYYQLGRIERAIEDYDRSIQLSPRSGEFYVNRAQAYALLNKDAEARQDYDLAVKLGFVTQSLNQD